MDREGAPSAGLASGAQIHPQLRQRMPNRAATFVEGVQSSPPAPSRRRSSLISDLSDSRYSLRSSTDNLRSAGNTAMENEPAQDGPTVWTSLPVVLAVVPPIIGLTVHNGAAIATDVVILALAAWFLNSCVRMPWDWYHEAQQRRYEFVDTHDALDDPSILEGDQDSIAGLHEHREEVPQPPKSRDSDKPGPTPSKAQQDARDALKREEMWAFILCFLGPLVGAFLLYIIRGQLSRAEGVVSDFNLGIFVLGAEIRPFDRLRQMKKEKIWHLQRIVRSAPPDDSNGANMQQLFQRIADLEYRLAGPDRGDADVSKMRAHVQQSNQLQLDALNRAVRRYEKRQVVLDSQTNARFRMLEAQLRDALALAAAAARTGQRPGLIAKLISWTVSMTNYYMQFVWNVATYPLRTVAIAVETIESWFLDEKGRIRSRGRQQTNGHSDLTASRVRSKSATYPDEYQ
ncbi:hypothetical protein ACN47E_003361 [Coniothyrium glycines]